MTTSTKHHFVPQFYFRNFSADGKTINLLHEATGSVIHGARIRGQAQRRNFYLTPEVENTLSQLESKQSTAIRAIIRAADENKVEHFYNERELMWLWNFITVQHSRTPFEAEKTARLQERMALLWFRQNIQIDKRTNRRRKEMLAALDAGQVTLTMKREYAALLRLDLAMHSAILISDLEVVVLRNATDIPFIFSDSPVVLFNQYLSRITDSGTLGLQSPGLQIFVPLSERVAVMLIDPDRYYGRFQNNSIIDLIDASDVGFLNAFQVHNSLAAVYFGDSKHGDYIKSLWAVHRSSAAHETTVYREYTPSQSTDHHKHGVNKLIHSIERQIDVNPNFSFVNCDALEPAKFKRFRRSPELVKEFDALTGNPKRKSMPDGVTRPIKMRDKDGNQVTLLPKQQ